MERSVDWIDEAQGDLEHAKSDVEGSLYNWACFSAQQGAEKAIKAVFQRMGAEAWGILWLTSSRNFPTTSTFQKT